MLRTTEILIAGQDVSYPIFIGYSVDRPLIDFLDHTSPSKLFVIWDEKVFFSWRDTFQFLNTTIPQSTLVLDSKETTKCFGEVENICTFLNENECDRNSLLIAIGGGVVCDLVGFVASIYYRGVSCVYLPTTLLSQVDASIGGKTGINFNSLKNVIGTFTSPIGVFIGIEFLSTLSERERNSGFAEIIKHALVADYDLYQDLLKVDLYNLDLEKIVARSIGIKADIVERDWLEKGERKILNFGHTLGHVLESYSLDSSECLLHGEAVSLGIVAATYISLVKGLISSGELESIERLLDRFQLPIRLTQKPEFEEIVRLLSKDKKSISGKVNWTLLESIGKGIINQSVSNEECQQAFDYLSTNL